MTPSEVFEAVREGDIAGVLINHEERISANDARTARIEGAAWSAAVAAIATLAGSLIAVFTGHLH